MLLFQQVQWTKGPFIHYATPIWMKVDLLSSIPQCLYVLSLWHLRNTKQTLSFPSVLYVIYEQPLSLFTLDTYGLICMGIHRGFIEELAPVAFKNSVEVYRVTIVFEYFVRSLPTWKSPENCPPIPQKIPMDAHVRF